MKHKIYGDVLTCFYHDFNNPQEVGSISFKLESNKINKIEMLNSTYSDQPFIIKSLVSPNKKKLSCMLCKIFR